MKSHLEDLTLLSSLQEAIKSRLCDLPDELLNSIVAFVCAGREYDVMHASVMALRSCCKSLKTSSDFSRKGIVLTLHQIKPAFSYLSKLKNLSAVTIHAPLSDRWENVHDPLFQSLDLLGSVISDLVSLTVHSAKSRNICMRVFASALLPWRKSLRHLVLHGCTPIFCSRESGGSSINVPSWSPNIPLLETLALRGGAFTSLDLRCCPMLQSLELVDNDLLSDLKLPAMIRLEELICVRNEELLELDLSSSSQLRTVMCRDNLYLQNLVLTGCLSLQVLATIGNNSLVSLDLTDCGSLKTYECDSNSSLTSLDMEHCNKLQKFLLKNNGSLAQLTVPLDSSLEQMLCEENHALLTLDVSGLKLLQVLHCNNNHKLERLSVSLCQTLKELVCEDNPLLSVLKLSGCVALAVLHIQNNLNLTDVSIPDCKALETLHMPAANNFDMSVIPCAGTQRTT